MTLYTTNSGKKILLVTVTVDGSRVVGVKRAESPMTHDQTVGLEAHHLAELLGYTQRHSIRKQVQSDWKHLFREHHDFWMAHGITPVRDYENLYDAWVGPIREMKLDRGRMFLTATGIAKVFERTSKDSRELQEVFSRIDENPKGVLPLTERPVSSDQVAFTSPEDLTITNISDVEDEVSVPENPWVQTVHEEVRPVPLYEVLETLLGHVKDTGDVSIRRLALMSAEVGAGQELHDVREILGIPLPAKAKEPTKVESTREATAREHLASITTGAFPDSPEFHSLGAIGERAGGYSSRSAGKAADLVAARMGYSHDDIRRRKLFFNSLPSIPDAGGKPRQRYHFSSRFANLVVAELRSNPAFKPRHTWKRNPFGEGGDRLPKLSQDVLGD